MAERRQRSLPRSTQRESIQRSVPAPAAARGGRGALSSQVRCGDALGLPRDERGAVSLDLPEEEETELEDRQAGKQGLESGVREGSNETTRRVAGWIKSY